MFSVTGFSSLGQVQACLGRCRKREAKKPETGRRGKVIRSVEAPFVYTHKTQEMQSLEN